ncbi:hypothetical protein [Nocardia asteroides]|uniref:Integral membrane protein n=1 Tax=Nocardia asteroides NBRC 15531 TaxID=1110697 RepID=U5EGH9_NOCAS|nr:hypothetical protein [Nocardia asteroides]TLF69193.1 hypothetical protein FEK33_02435 [Nocardia asteroides NBRC 15531]UGT48680.1 hypothetical protein LT345_30280 [Nocardia asteroides]SFL67689.1 hypothetical protein SAMN05444423_101499 [Nocardia asteroides]VEG31711.1 Uncharacterised protein [Nocardia asteroides]GAD85501.1 hypothetical protein NCAST_31_01970 [Nocardia asteroides NBRC 15531]
MTVSGRRILDQLIALALLVALVPCAGIAAMGAAYFEVSNHTCGYYGGCHTPWVTRGVYLAWAGAVIAVLGSTIWIAIGIAKGRRVGYVPLVGALLLVVTFVLGGVISGWA